MKIKRPSAREVALTLLRIAGYHDDHATFTRVYIESRVSLEVAKESFRTGRTQRIQGMRCTCHDCASATKYDKIEFHDDEPDKYDRRYFTLFWTDPCGRYESAISKADGQPVGYRHAQVFRSDQWRKFQPLCALTTRAP